MPDEIAPAAPAAPVVEAAPVAPAPVETVAPAPAPAAVDAAPAAEPAATPAPEGGEAKPANDFAPSLLDAAAQPESPKPAEAAPSTETPAGDKPADAKPDAPGETPPAPITYEFKYPEHIKPEDLNSERMSAYTGILGEARVASEVGQKLLDLHLNELNHAAESLAQRQWDVFNETQNRWRNEVMSDPVLGQRDAEGNLTSIRTIMSLVDQYGGNAQERKDLLDAFRITGAANNPAVLRFMHRAGKALAVEATPHPAPPPRSAPQDPRTRRMNNRYGNSTPGG